MKFGIFADVHGNIQALRAVLAALDDAQCLRLICLGDVVGYGPDPQACVDLLRERDIPTVRGNHDDWVAHDRIPIGARPDILHTLGWTRDQLDAHARTWLRELPHHYEMAGISFIHACHGSKDVWPYIRDERSLRYNFLHQTRRLAFCGHTHVPAIGAADLDGVRFLHLRRQFTLPPDTRLIINPGSVGQPRDGDPGAAYCIFETRDHTVHFKKAAYDLTLTQHAMSAAGLPEAHSLRLTFGK